MNLIKDLSVPHMECGDNVSTFFQYQIAIGSTLLSK